MAKPTFEFELKANADGEPLNRVAFGGDPRIVVEKGTPFKTTDAAIAARARAHPHLVETTTKTAAKQLEAAEAEAEDDGQ